MAQQYSSAPSYGAQYPAPSYYSPFTPSAGQQMSSATPTYQQSIPHHANPQTPTPLTNAARFDSNAHLSAHPAPLTFAPHFNPDFLKHFPPPPPPPPPNAHFGIGHGNVPGFLHFPQPVNSPIPQVPQQGFPQFPQAPATLNGGTGPVQTQIVQSHDPSILANQFHPQMTPVQAVDESLVPKTSLSRPPDGNHIGRSSIPGLAHEFANGSDNSSSVSGGPGQVENRGDVALQPPRHSTVESGLPVQANNQLQVPKVATESELKERAKVALLSLVPHNIRYDDFLNEGVSGKILQQLYSELGLNWKGHGERSGKSTPTAAGRSIQKTEETGLQEQFAKPVQTPSTAATPTTIVKPTSAAVSFSRASPGTGANMERKDRIAQLLAAKAGKVASSGVGSKSQSPVSTSGLAQSQRVESATIEMSECSPIAQVEQGQGKTGRNMAQTEIVKQKMEQLRRETLARTRGERSEQVQKTSADTAVSDAEQDIAVIISQIQDTNTLTTPVREHLLQNGFAPMIPGLFMTSAELDDDNAHAHNAPSLRLLNGMAVDTDIRDASAPVPTNGEPVTIYTPDSSRKRSLVGDSLDDREHPRSKRRAIEDEEMFDVSMEVDNELRSEASEGEIVEDGEDDDQGQQALPEKSTTFQSNYGTPNQHSVNMQVTTENMRKQIIEKEQRKPVKSKQTYVLSPTESANSTPTTLQAPQTILNSSLTRGPEPPSVKIDERGIQSPRSLVKATPEQIAERAAQLKAGLLRQKALRQKQLQEGLPALNDEVAKTQSKLSETRAKLVQIRKELQQHEANLVRTRHTEEELVSEIESLQKQISEGISGQKHFSNELSKLNQGNKDEPPQTDPVQTAVEQQVPKPEEITQQNPQEVLRDSDIPTISEDLQAESAPVIVDSHQHTTSGLADRLENGAGVKIQYATNVGISKNANASDDNVKVLDSPEQTIVERASAEPRYLGPSMEPVAEQLEESTDDSDEAMEESDEESDDSRMSIDEESNHSASMSGSGSDDYEPAEPELSHRPHEKVDSDEYEPEGDGSQSDDERVEDEADDYEPAEEYEPTEDMASIDTPGAVSNESTALAISDTQELNGVASQTLVAISQVSQLHPVPGPDDQEAGLQLSEADTLIKPQNVSGIEEEDGSYILGATEPSSVRYAPYQSPLTSFKSYRFHPLFNISVKDGYRSLTYSHKIDPKLPLCPSELNGIVCTDPQCQEQHFGSMALKDDKILVQMSSANDIKDKPLRDQYLIGLKQVIARLRQEGVKEFSAVADALSQYRRQWTTAQNGI